MSPKWTYPIGFLGKPTLIESLNLYLFRKKTWQLSISNFQQFIQLEEMGILNHITNSKNLAKFEQESVVYQISPNLF